MEYNFRQELDHALTQSSVTAREIRETFEAHVAEGSPLHLTGLPRSAFASMLANLRSEKPILVLVDEPERAVELESALRSFGAWSGAFDPSEVVLFPALDTSPYLEVAPDRRASMDRLSVLFRLAKGISTRFVIAPTAAVIRRIPPPGSMLSRSMLVEQETELEREDLIDVLEAGGYVRTPVASDPGTYAVRGGIVDVYPPQDDYPARIELDDWLVASLKSFDPDTQRTVDSLKRFFVQPVRDTILPKEGREEVLHRVRDLCDELNVPTRFRTQLLDDLDAGRYRYGVDALLPAFYDGLATLFDYLPDSQVVLVHPTRIRTSVDLELSRATHDHDAKREAGGAAYPLEALYMDEDELAERLEKEAFLALHAVQTIASGEHAFDIIEEVPEDATIASALEHLSLKTALDASRQTRSDDALAPVSDQIRAWFDAGLRVICTARNVAQGQRLHSLLKSFELPVAPFPRKEPESPIAQAPDGRVHILIGSLEKGFVWPAEALALLTESEIFGTRQAKKKKRRRRKTKVHAGTFLEDLRELQVGDFVVHADHGIGRYTGIERKALMQSSAERIRGDAARFVELLVIEYRNGDKLLLPVTRLSQIQKFAGRGAKAPKLDKLGGQSFEKKKARVRKAVRQMADQLLKLYAERAACTRVALPPAGRLYEQFEATFPFEETPDQARAIEDVLGDLESSRPMDRLVCGDVGFGKTEVAMRAAFRVAMEGRQVAVLCPTTVLAQQHYQNFLKRMDGYPLEIRTLSRFVSAEDSRETSKGLKAGTVDIVIGTHRLLSKDIHFKNLGMLVVDEEQRFGVTHKERIKQLRSDVDVLTLTATPIPRTLHLAIGGLRELSLIATPPTDRRAVRTFAARWDDHLVRDAVQRELSRGGQVFFVYNRVDGLYERAQRLQSMLPDARILVAHGQMKEGELERVMTDFVDGEGDVLCATAIIESGIDISRANTMIIDRADMFGLAQLYQLRGRVGRSRERAYCYLITPPPSKMTDEARARIEALERFTELGSGFKVASLDMELRGVGDLLGAEQSGNVAMVGFDLFVKMLDEAIALLRGEQYVEEIDPEITIDLEHYIPEEYIDEVALRLSFYKRLSTAPDEDAVQDVAEEMEDRFGPPPTQTLDLIRIMSLRPALKYYRALGLEAGKRRVTLHLRQDTVLDPAKVIGLVRVPDSPWKLSADMRLSYRFEEGHPGDSVDRARELLRMLVGLRRDDSS